jgi:hypothetical protein
MPVTRKSNRGPKPGPGPAGRDARPAAVERRSVSTVMTATALHCQAGRGLRHHDGFTVRVRPVGPDGCGPVTDKEIRTMSGPMSERAPDITVEADGRTESTTVLVAKVSWIPPKCHPATSACCASMRFSTLAHLRHAVRLQNFATCMRNYRGEKRNQKNWNRRSKVLIAH